MQTNPINAFDYVIDRDRRKPTIRTSFIAAIIIAVFIALLTLVSPLFSADWTSYANQTPIRFQTNNGDNKANDNNRAPYNAQPSNIAHPFFNGNSSKAKFYQETKRGWFYYETIKEETLKEEEEPAKEAKNRFSTENETIVKETTATIKQTPIANLYPIIDNSQEARAPMLQAEKAFIRSIPFDNLETLSAEEFRQAYDKVRDIATMRPNLENSLAYMRLNKFSVAQADRFKEIMLIVSNENEFIDPSLAYNAYGGGLIREQEKRKLKTFFETNKEKLAITIFYGGIDHLSYEKQKGAVEAFQRDYPNTEILWIDVSNSPETIEKMGLLTIPETWLAYEKDDGSVIWRRITSGVADYADLERKPLFLWEKTIEGDVLALDNAKRN